MRRGLLTLLLGLFTGSISAGPGTIPDQPLFTEGLVKHNMMFILDDSGSMDFTMLMPTNDGAIWWDGTRESFGDPTDPDTQYLNFDASGAGSQIAKKNRVLRFWRGGWSDAQGVPPIRHYGFLRSALYNASYYDPATAYTPWPSYGGYSFDDADETAACYDPFETANTSADPVDCNNWAEVDLTTPQSLDYYIEDGMACDNDCPAESKDGSGSCSATCAGGPSGNTNTSDDETITFWVPTYYDNATSGTFKIASADLRSTGVAGGSLPPGSVDLWVEDFGLTDGTTSDAGPTPWGRDTSNTAKSNPTAEVETNRFRVSNSGDGNGGNPLTEYVEWQSDPIDISSATSSAGFSLEIEADGDMEATGTWEDRIEVDYRVDGGPWQDAYGQSDNVDATVVEDGLSGSDLEIRVRANTTGGSESFFLDDIRVANTGVAGPTAGFCNESGGIYTCDCANYDPTDPIGRRLYRTWEQDPTVFGSFNGFPTLSGATFQNPTFSPADFAIGPDGRCLRKHEIKANTPEMQNFANWFEFYRKRHQAMRNGVARALQNVGGVNVGLFWINRLRGDIKFDPGNPGGSEMWDWDADKTRNPSEFLKDHYGHVGGGGTPLREALEHALDQYRRDVTSDSDAPLKQECQQNFSVLFTDGFNSGSSNAGNVDGQSDASREYPTPLDPYQDNHDDTLADIAMDGYLAGDTDNLNPNLPHSQVPIPASCPVAAPNPLDCNNDLHMNTYTVGLGAKGEIVGQTHFDVQDAYSNPPNWADPGTSRNPRQIDDLYHAAINGRGSFENADNPADLAQAFNTALSDIIAAIGSSAAVSFNTGRLEAGSLLYTTLINSRNWRGRLRALGLNPITGDLEAEVWDASQLLDSRDLGTNPRVILTHDGSDGIPFQWGDLTSDQKADLKLDRNENPDSNGPARLDYIRGDRSNEGSGLGFRNRDSRLGDIINSQAVFVGAPDDPWPDTAPFPTGVNAYSGFQAAQDDRRSAVYVGANDGMLHGFYADNGTDGGEEILGYIPNAVFSDNASGDQHGLHFLSNPSYDHEFYVDLSSTARDVFIDVGNGPEWRTVLIGGTRGGGRGVFALDVTDPKAFSEDGSTCDGSNCAAPSDTVLWEFQDPDLGFAFSKAAVGRFNNGGWYAVIGNGYNSAAFGDARLILLKIEGGIDGSWDSGDLRIIQAPGGTGNGLGSPTPVDTDGDRVFDRVYAGDLKGQMHAFDVSDPNPSNWQHDYVLFKAGDTQPGTDHPITTKPDVAFHPNQPKSGNEPNLMVMFGTGQYLAQGDQNLDACPPGSTSTGCTQRFYSVWDNGDPQLASTAYGESDLVEQLVTDFVDNGTTESGTSVDARTLTKNTVDYDQSTPDKGCFLKLPRAGERSVTDPLVVSDLVFFNTTIPSNSPCEGGGSGFLMSMNYTTCSLEEPAFDLDGDRDVDSSDTIGGDAPTGIEFDGGLPSASSLIGSIRYTSGTNTPLPQRNTLQLDAALGRASWQEILR
jgi:type IV pilus assembly protein PilY1